MEASPEAFFACKAKRSARAVLAPEKLKRLKGDLGLLVLCELQNVPIQPASGGSAARPVATSSHSTASQEAQITCS